MPSLCSITLNDDGSYSVHVEDHEHLHPAEHLASVQKFDPRIIENPPSQNSIVNFRTACNTFLRVWSLTPPMVSYSVYGVCLKALGLPHYITNRTMVTRLQMIFAQKCEHQ